MKEKLRILIVEDNQDAGVILRMLLDQLGFEAHHVDTGESAVSFASGFRPAVILMDIGLPGINGYEAARQIRAGDLGSSVLIVALTGWGHADDIQRAAEAGMDHHMTKPVDMEGLMDLLNGLSK